jgi:multiple sugar transport system permease protein
MITRHQTILFVPLLLLIVPFLLWPAAFGFVATLTNYAPNEHHLLFVGLDNYQAVINDPQFRASAVNNLAFTLASVSAEMVIGFAVAYALRTPFRGRSLMRLALLVPWLVSPIANGVMWHFLFNSQSGLWNYWLNWVGLTDVPSPVGIYSLALPTAVITEVWRSAPLVSFLLLPGLLAIPAELWEQATLDGASLFIRLRHVALPQLRLLLLTVALLMIGSALGEFDTILILTGGGPGTATFMPGLYSFQQAFRINNWPLGATSAWLIVFEVLLVGLGYLRLARTKAERQNEFELASSAPAR